MSVATYVQVWANSSLISYSGEWNLSSYMPLAGGARASIDFVGSGVAFRGVGDLGSDSINGGIITLIDDGSSTAKNFSMLGSGSDDPTRPPGPPIQLPPGRHTADMIFNGQPRNFTFAGFQLTHNVTTPKQETWVTYTAGQRVEDDQIRWFGDQTTQPAGWSVWDDAKNVTSVSGPNTGFGFNFSGAGLAVYGSSNASADVDYSVYFNMTEPPSDNFTQPFGNYTQKQGTGGVIFFVGAMPAGEHSILFVNKGDTPLALERAVVAFPGNHTDNLSTCYVNCTQAERQELAGTEFGAGSRIIPGWKAMGLALALSTVVSALSTAF